MTLQSSGAIKFSEIQTEFGGANPIALGEYYAGGTYVNSGTTGVNGAVPSSGAIAMSKFYGTSDLIVADWNNISHFESGSPLTGTNPAVVIAGSGTIDINYYTTYLDPGVSVSFKIFKNTVDQGNPTSLSLSNGDSVYFSVTMTGPFGSSSAGNIEILQSGSSIDTIAWDLTRT